MDKNDINLDDDILDPLELDGNDSNNGYVPKFERDLEKMGSLEALSKAKKAEENEQTDSEEDSSAEAEAADNADNYNDIPDDEFYAADYGSDFNDNSYSAENEENPHYQYHTKPVSENDNQSETRRAKSFADFAREAEEQERIAREEAAEAKNNKTDHNLDDVQVSADMLSDMGYSERKNTANNIRQQMEMDDMAMEMGEKPKLEEMSSEYAPTRQRAADLTSKESLDKDEKQLIKERLEKEIGKRPQGYSKKTSLEMYHTLMREQKIKRAKKGFFVVLMLVAMGIIVSVITYFKLNWNDTQLFMYMSFAAAAAAIILLVKAKFFKVISCVYFAVNTVLLIGPGFVKFALDTAYNPNTYIETLVYFIIAIALSAIICIQLCTSATIDAYYTTNLLTEKKKVVDARKSKYRQ